MNKLQNNHNLFTRPIYEACNTGESAQTCYQMVLIMHIKGEFYGYAMLGNINIEFYFLGKF